MATIITKNSTTPSNIPGTIVQGELAINTADGKLFYGSGSVAKEYTASLALTASFISGTILSASYATTASYALNGGVTQLIAGTGTTLSPANGLGVVTINSHATTTSGSNTTSSFTNEAVWLFNHNLGNKYVIIQTFDSNSNQIIPENIELNNTSLATITFPTSESGYAVASLGGAASSSYALYAATTALPNYIIISASYDIILTDAIIEVSSSNITCSLPTAISNIGRQFTVINASTGSILLFATGSQKIGNGNPETSTSQTIFQEDSITVISNNSNWRII